MLIECWLNGDSREDITKKQTIGSSQFNIIREWAKGMGVQRADILRVLAIKLKKNRLTITDSAQGFRILMVFKKYGIAEDDQEKVTHFLKEIYTQCKLVGLTSHQVFLYISDILNFSSEVSISKIPLYMKKKIQEKEELEGTMQELSRKIDELTKIHDEKKQELQRLLEI